VSAWAKHDGPPELPPEEDALLHVRRLVAHAMAGTWRSSAGRRIYADDIAVANVRR
jgi:hypothetical protein